MGLLGLIGTRGGISWSPAALDAYLLKRSTRFNDDDSAFLNRTPVGQGNRQTWTFSCWFKRGKITSSANLLAAYGGGGNYAADNYLQIYLSAADKIRIYGNTEFFIANPLLRDTSAWYNLVVAFDTTLSTADDRIKVYLNGERLTKASGTAPIQDDSLAINNTIPTYIGTNDGSSELFDGYISDVHLVDGLALDATSFGETDDTTGQWVPKEYTHVTATDAYHVVNNGTTWSSGAGANFDSSLPASNGFDGSSSTYTRTDNANVTATVTLPSSVPFTTLQVRGARDSGNGAITVNGVNVSSQFTSSSATLETVTITGVTSPLTSIALTGISGAAQPRFAQIIVDGIILTDDAIDNSFHLAMDPAQSGTTWSDVITATGSGGVSGISANDTLAKAFNGYSSNYCGTTVGDISVNAAVLTFTFPSGSQPAYTSTVKVETWSGSSDTVKAAINGGAWQTVAASGAYVNHTVASGSGTITELKISRLKGNTNDGAAEIKSITVDGKVLVDHTAIGNDSSGQNNHWHDNNLVSSVSTIAEGKFKAVTYTGTGSSQAISCGFQPDLVWIKDRTLEPYAHNHQLLDTVRGAPNIVLSDDTKSEITNSTDGVTALTSTGFTLGANTLGDQGSELNKNGNTYVAWCWKAGGAAVSNTDGSITSSVSASTETGFSIVKWSAGASAGTVGHGLGTQPSLILMKTLDLNLFWFVYRNDIGAGKYLKLNTNDSTSTDGTVFSTAPTSSVFSPGSGFTSGNSYGDTVAYCWSEIGSYSKFSRYTGNGSATGPVVDCGFKPAFIMVKASSTTGDWLIWDAGRNLGYGALAANLHNGESYFGTTNSLSVTETGFQITTSNAVYNTSGETYIYAAFADLGSPSTLDLLADVPGAPYDNGLNGGGNYCTLNPIAQSGNYSNGNLQVGTSNNTNPGTIAVSSGKWYWEATVITANSTNELIVGIIDPNQVSGSLYVGETTLGWGYSYNGNYYNSDSNTTPFSAYTDGDVIGVAFDLDANTLTFYKNNTAQTAQTITAGTYTPAVSGAGTSNDGTVAVNFGQRAFTYTPPTGYKSLNVFSLPQPTIVKPNTVFDTKLYTGDGSTQSVNGIGFSPDLTWIKSRSATYDHALFDEVRGPLKRLRSNQTNSEDTDTTTLTSFNSDGFTTGADDVTNKNNDAYISWNWDAGTTNTSVSVGGLNSSVYDQSATWSSGSTVSGTGASLNNATSGFNGNSLSGSYAWIASSGSVTANVTFTCTTTDVTKVEVFAHSTSSSGDTRGTCLDSGGTTHQSATLTSAAQGWHTIYSGPAITLANVGWGINQNGASGTSSDGFRAFRVNGKMLVDIGVTLTNVPSVNTTYRANNSAGFSIMTYTGTGSNETVCHSLDVAPSFIVAKSRTNASGPWYVYHKSIGYTQYLKLNDITAASAYAVWPEPPDLKVFTGGSDSVMASADYVAYAWSEVAGYSKFGSYNGDGSEDGPFIHLGFKPALIITKAYSSNSNNNNNWITYDTALNTFNESENIVYPNSSAAENTHASAGIDILSNGFKLKADAHGYSNYNGWDYIYCAWAEAPGKYSNAR